MVPGCGRTGPDPKDDLVLKDGTIVPLGKGVDTGVQGSSLLYNEYPFFSIRRLFIVVSKTLYVLCIKTMYFVLDS